MRTKQACAVAAYPKVHAAHPSKQPAGLPHLLAQPRRTISVTLLVAVVMRVRP